MAGLGVATLESSFDPSGLRNGLNSARSMTEGWLSGWGNLWSVTAGFIIAQVIGKIAGAIRNLGRDVIGAVSSFQLLEIQLRGLVGGELFGGGGFSNFNDAVDAGSYRVQELIGWIKMLAVTTPFTVQTLQRTLANAMAMGFTSKEAQGLTKSIGNFTAGMGLSQEVMERIIYNFGQMKAAGKVTGTELRDLARGGFVPIVDVLKRMQENLGLTNITFEEFRELAGAGEIDVNAFFTAFEQMVGERFPNSMEAMSKTFAGLTSNIKDFFQSVLGAGVLGPAFDQITAELADAFQQILTPEMLASFNSLGRTLAMFTGIDLDMSWAEDLRLGMDNLSSSLQRFAVSGDMRTLLQDLNVPQETIDLLFKVGDAFKWISENLDVILAVGGALLAANIFMGLASGIVAFVAALAAGAWIPLLIGAIVVGIILLAAAFQTNFGGIRDKIMEVWVQVQPVLQRFGEFLEAIFGDRLRTLLADAGELFAQFKQNIAPLQEAFITFLPVLEAAVVGLIGIVMGLIEGILTGVNWFLRFFGVMQQGLFMFIAGLMNVITGFITFFVNLFSGDFKGAWDSFVLFITGLVQIVVGLLTALVGIFLAQLAMISGIIYGFIEGVIAYFQNLYMVLVGGSIVPQMLNMIVSIFTTSLNLVLTLVRAVFNFILNTILLVMNTAVKSVKAGLSLLINAFYNLMVAGNYVITWLLSKFAAAFAAAQKAVARVIGAVNSLLKALQKLAENMPSILKPGSPTPFEMGLRGIHDAMNALRSQAIPALGGAFDSKLSLTPTLASSPSSLMAGMGLNAGGSKQYNFYMQKSDLNEDQLRRALQRAEVLYG